MKVTKEQFLVSLRKALGNYTVCAKIIEKEFDVTYTRQAAEDRAKNYPEELADIIEYGCDFAESVVVNIMKDGKGAVNLKAAVDWLNAKGTHRGWGNKTQIEIKGNEFLDMPPEERALILKAQAAQIEMNKLNETD